jgi:hypothetical protein
MKAQAVYRHEIRADDEKEIHAIDHDGGGFLVSSAEVGVAVQNFLNNALPQDLAQLHNHLLYQYAKQYHEMMLLPEED